jgi:hypothetical protein
LINNNHTVWECLCGAPTTVLHEIIPGSFKRKFCIQNTIQVPQCQKCHEKRHKSRGFGGDPAKRELCEAIGVNINDVIEAIAGDKSARELLQRTKDKRDEFLNNRIIEGW